MMAGLEGAHITSEILWRAAVLFALFDVVLVMYLARFIEPELFQRMKKPLIVITALFWFLLWLIMVIFLWEPVYHYVFPSLTRWLIPPVLASAYACLGLFFWWLAQRFKGSPVVNFCLLGGIWGMVTHVWAIYTGVLEKVPLLQGTGPVAASIMPIFEFMCCWCIILGIAFIWAKRNIPE